MTVILLNNSLTMLNILVTIKIYICEKNEPGCYLSIPVYIGK